MGIDMPVLPYLELRGRLEGMPFSDPLLRDRALLSLVYASLGRVGEVVKGRYRESPAIRKRDLVVQENGLHLDIRVHTEKVDIVRIVPVNRELEGWLVDPILSYARRFEDDAAELFPHSTRWAEKIFQKHFPEFGQHIHLMRKWRATHLLQGKCTRKRLTINEVKRMGGWTKLDALARVYDYSVIEDYREMI